MSFWLVRANYDGKDQTQRFLNENLWENGYEDKYHSSVNRVEVNDILLLTNGSNIEYYSRCIRNQKDGKQLAVDKWIKLSPAVHFLAKGAYIKTIVKIADKNILSIVQERTTHESRSIKIKKIKTKNLTLLRNCDFEFSQNLNIFIGENGSAKTHLLKTLFSINEAALINANKTHYTETAVAEDILNETLEYFRTRSIEDLISYEQGKCEIDVETDNYQLSINFTKNSSSRVNIDHCSINTPLRFNQVFIPAKEFLSHYKGFSWLYESRHISFDKTFYTLCKALDAPLLKNLDKNSEKDKLEAILDGQIIKENGEFYLYKKNKNKILINMIAEGLRKVGTIAYLISNGILSEGSLLFWDEPESNLNPKIIKDIARTIISLSEYNIQIFIATHSLFLLKEIEILRKEKNQIKYFNLTLNEDKDAVTLSQSNRLEDLDEILLLEEELKQSDRFMDGVSSN